MDHVQMRHHNASQTLDCLFRRSPATMASLQSDLGLSRRTLELILNDLVAQGWVREVFPEPGALRPQGRPARAFAFRYEAAHLVALQVNATSITATVTDLATIELSEVSMRVPLLISREKRLRFVEECTTQALEKAGAGRATVIAVTVSTPGIIRDDGTVDLPMTIPDWSGFSLSDVVAQLFDCPVSVENDAKLAALGEKWAREGEVRHFVYIFSDGQRIGLGLVFEGELYRGADGAAGELSWGPGLGAEGLRSALLDGLSQVTGAAYDAANATLAAARSGEAFALTEVQSIADSLAPAVASLAWLLAPEEILLGGTLALMDDLLVPLLQAGIAADPMPSRTRVGAGRFGARSVLVGCFGMNIISARERMMSGQVPGALVPEGPVSRRQ